MADINFNLKAKDLEEIKKLFAELVKMTAQIKTNVSKFDKASDDAAKKAKQAVSDAKKLEASRIRANNTLKKQIQTQKIIAINEQKVLTTTIRNETAYKRAALAAERVNKSIEKGKTNTNLWSKALGSFQFKFNALGNIAANVLSTMTRQAKQFIVESVKMAAATEGVSQAFLKLNRKGYLDELRKATRGAVSDLSLMKAAVQAENFKIPINQLAVLLKFAGDRALSTGEDFDYLVKSIVLGLGRKSVKILDNLGLSVIEIKEEVKKVGDFMQGTSNVIQREMAKSGVVLDTTQTTMWQLRTATENLKLSFGNFILKAIGPSIASLTEFGKTMFTSKTNTDKFVSSIEQEKIQLNSLVKTILGANNTQDSRLRLITELSTKYPEFLKGLDAEKVSNQQIATALESANIEYDKKIKSLILQELYAKKAGELADLYIRESIALKKIVEFQDQTTGMNAQENSETINKLAGIWVDELEEVRRQQSKIADEIQGVTDLIGDQTDAILHNKDVTLSSLQEIEAARLEQAKAIYEANKRAREGDKEADEEYWDWLIQGTKETADTIAGFKNDEAALEEESNAMAKKVGEDLLRQTADEEAKKQALKQATFATIGNGVNSLSTLYEANKQKELSAAGDNAEKRLAIEKKYLKKQQNLSISQALVSAAQGGMATYDKLGFPLAIPFIIAGSAFAAIQIAAIKAQKFGKGGKVEGRYHSQGGTLVEAERDEWIINRNSSRKYDKLIEGINQDDQMKIMMSMNQDKKLNGSAKRADYTKKLYEATIDREVGYETPEFFVVRKGTVTTKYKKVK